MASSSQIYGTVLRANYSYMGITFVGNCIHSEVGSTHKWVNPKANLYTKAAELGPTSSVGTSATIYADQPCTIPAGTGKIIISDSNRFDGIATVYEAARIGQNTDQMFQMLLGSNYSQVISTTAAEGTILPTFILYDLESSSGQTKIVCPGLRYQFEFVTNGNVSGTPGYYTKFKMILSYRSGSTMSYLYGSASTDGSSVVFNATASNFIGNGTRGTANNPLNYFLTIPERHPSTGGILTKVQLEPYGATSTTGNFVHNQFSKFHFRTLKLTPSPATDSAETDLSKKCIALPEISKVNARLIDSPSKTYTSQEVVKYRDLTYTDLSSPTVYNIYVMYPSTAPTGSVTVSFNGAQKTGTPAAAYSSDHDGYYHKIGTISSTSAPATLLQGFSITGTSYDSTAVCTVSSNNFYIHPPLVTYSIYPLFNSDAATSVGPNHLKIWFYGTMTLRSMHFDGYTAGDGNSGFATALPTYVRSSVSYSALNIGGTSMHGTAQLYFGNDLTGASYNITEIQAGECDDRGICKKPDTCNYNVYFAADQSVHEIYMLVKINQIG